MASLNWRSFVKEELLCGNRPGTRIADALIQHYTLAPIQKFASLKRCLRQYGDGANVQVDVRTSKTTAISRNNGAGGTLSEGATSGTAGPTRYKVRGQWRVQGTFKKFKILGIPLFKKRLK